MTELVFLGTGGGRFVLTTQKRKTGGFLIKTNKTQIHVDPGPGAIVNVWEARENPGKTRYVFISHAHTDHYTCAPAIVEAMTRGTTKRMGRLVGSRMALEGYEDETPILSKFHRGLVEDLIVSEPGKKLEFPEFSVIPSRTVHAEPTGTGFLFNLGKMRLGYTADTSYFPGLEDYFSDSDVLIINTICPELVHREGLMTLGDGVELAKLVDPDLVIIQHFGMRALNFGPERMARSMEEKTGIRTIAARDFMRINLEEELEKPSLARFIK